MNKEKQNDSICFVVNDYWTSANFFGRLIKELEKRNLSLSKVSFDAGLSSSTLSYTRDKGTYPNLGTLILVLNYLGIKLKDFFAEEDDKNPDELLEKIRTVFKEVLQENNQKQ